MIPLPTKDATRMSPGAVLGRSVSPQSGKTAHSWLLFWTAVGILLTAVLTFAVMTFFVRLIDGEGPWWPVWKHRLSDGQWFEAARVTVALVALTVAGGAAYLAYRRQRTADDNQKTAAATQLITAQAYDLSTRQHDAALRRELRTRFTDAAEQLAHTSAAVRIAGVYAIAALADDWHSHSEPNETQTCIDVLCGYLRLPYDPEHAISHQTKRVIKRPRTDSEGAAVSGEVEEHFEFRQNDREVRKTILRVIRDHLRVAAIPSWSAHAFDFHGAVLEDTDLSKAMFRGPVSFIGVEFHGERTSFTWAEFRGEQTLFTWAEFRGEQTSFTRAKFHSKSTTFDSAEFHSTSTSFDESEFHGEQMSFDWSGFRGEQASFTRAKFHSKSTTFDWAEFHSKWTSFTSAAFRSEQTSFTSAEFHSTSTSFNESEFHGEHSSFTGAEFHGEQASFDGAKFYCEIPFDFPGVSPGVEHPTVSLNLQ